MDLKDIKVIVDLMKKNAVSEFEMEEGDFKIKLKRESGKPRKGETVVVQEAAPMILPAAAAAPAAVPVAAATPAPGPSSCDPGTSSGRTRGEVANDRHILSKAFAGCRFVCGGRLGG